VYLKTFAIAKSRVSNKLPKFLAGIDGSVIFGLETRAEGLREEAVVPNWNLIVCCVFAVDEALDGVTAIVENEPVPQCQRNNAKPSRPRESFGIRSSIVLCSGGKRGCSRRMERCLGTNMTFFRLCRSISEIACTVNCSEPSPVIKTPLLYSPVSLIPWNAPTAVPVAYPILPKTV
jgi:hypothetical protein